MLATDNYSVWRMSKRRERLFPLWGWPCLSHLSRNGARIGEKPRCCDREIDDLLGAEWRVLGINRECIWPVNRRKGRLGTAETERFHRWRGLERSGERREMAAARDRERFGEMAEKRKGRKDARRLHTLWETERERENEDKRAGYARRRPEIMQTAANSIEVHRK